MKRDGAGWDDHPAAGFESALVRIALAIEMQRYLWMSAEVEKTRQRPSGCNIPELGLGLGCLGSDISVLGKLLAILKDFVAHGPIVFLW